MFVAPPANHVVAEVPDLLVSVLTVAHVEASNDEFQPASLQLLKYGQDQPGTALGSGSSPSRSSAADRTSRPGARGPAGPTGSTGGTSSHRPRSLDQLRSG